MTSTQFPYQVRRSKRKPTKPQAKFHLKTSYSSNKCNWNCFFNSKLREHFRGDVYIKCLLSSSCSWATINIVAQKLTYMEQALG